MQHLVGRAQHGAEQLQLLAQDLERERWASLSVARKLITVTSCVCP